MNHLDKFDVLSHKQINEINQNLLDIGVYLDNMNFSNVRKNSRMIIKYLEIIEEDFSFFIDWISERVKERKIEDKKVKKTIKKFYSTLNVVRNYQEHVKKFETELNFKKGLKKLKKILYLLENLFGRLEEHLEDLKEIIFAKELNPFIQLRK